MNMMWISNASIIPSFFTNKEWQPTQVRHVKIGRGCFFGLFFMFSTSTNSIYTMKLLLVLANPWWSTNKHWIGNWTSTTFNPTCILITHGWGQICRKVPMHLQRWGGSSSSPPIVVMMEGSYWPQWGGGGGGGNLSLVTSTTQGYVGWLLLSSTSWWWWLLQWLGLHTLLLKLYPHPPSAKHILLGGCYVLH